jgi:DNA-binding NtrC family response regulator
MEHLLEYNWPGNVRELRNYIERAIALDRAPPTARRGAGVGVGVDGDGDGDGDKGAKEAAGDDARVVGVVDLSVPLKEARGRIASEFEHKYVRSLLTWAGGSVTRAARKADIDRISLHRMIQRHGLKGPRSIKD